VLVLSCFCIFFFFSCTHPQRPQTLPQPKNLKNQSFCHQKPKTPKTKVFVIDNQRSKTQILWSRNAKIKNQSFWSRNPKKQKSLLTEIYIQKSKNSYSRYQKTKNFVFFWKNDK